MSRTILLLSFLLAFSARPLMGQVDGATAGADELHSAAARVASLWSEQGVGALAGLLVERGIGFHTGGSGRETLDPRKAIAALDDLLARRRTRSSRVERVTMAAGTTERGSAEIAWEAVAPGTTEVLRYTVFIAFLREGSEWRISEIRVLP